MSTAPLGEEPLGMESEGRRDKKAEERNRDEDKSGGWVERGTGGSRWW